MSAMFAILLLVGVSALGVVLLASLVLLLRPAPAPVRVRVRGRER